jgi:hypothetical protein
MAIAIEAGPDLVRCPWVILVDKAEKAPFNFSGLRARSFIDAEQREYVIRTDRRYLGIGQGDYTIEGFEGRIAIERKSMADFQGTLLGWPVDSETVLASGSGRREIDRRGRFKSELRKLQAMEIKAVVVEATLGECLAGCPQWGVRTGPENAKYLFSTFLAWSQQFRVPWIFCDDREDAAVTAFRIMEQFWDRHRKEARQRAREMARSGT